MTSDPTTVDLQRHLRRHERRLDQLEQRFVAAGALVAGVLLVLGMLLPLVTEGDDGVGEWELPVGNLLTLATSALGGGTSDDSPVLGVLLLALAALSVAALVSLAMMAGERLSARFARAVPGLAVALLLGGTLVAGLALTAAAEGLDPGPGGVLLPLGSVAYAALAGSRLRDRWDPARRAHLVRAAQRSS